MRWTSTRRSIGREQITGLAIVETAVASGIAIALQFWLKQPLYFAIAATLAPLLLLRTEASTELGLRPWRASYRVVGALLKIPTPQEAKGKIWERLPLGILVVSFLVRLIAFVVLTPLVTAACKVLATFYSTLLHPLKALSAIPGNWRRVVPCTDVVATPELIPGIEAPLFLVEEADQTASIRQFKYREGDDPWYNVLRVIVRTVWWVPAELYRWSLKSTAVIWSPLLLVVKPIVKKDDVVLTMSRIVRGGVLFVARTYAAVVILLFAAKLALWQYLGPSEGIVAGPFAQMLRGFVAPDSLPPWQIAAVLAAALTWVIYFIAKWYLSELADGVAIPKQRLTGVVSGLQLGKNVLATYTALASLYIVFTSVDPTAFPPIGGCFFPWACE